MTKAIIFDFDGVLVLSEQPRFRVIQKSALKYGVHIAGKDIKKMVGRTTNTFLNAIFSEADKPLITDIIRDYEKEYKDNITKYVEPIAFTVDFIKKYHGSFMFALASMSSRRVIEELTKHYGIYEKFSTIICKEDVVHHKPDPEIYLKSAKELLLEPLECVMIEDTIVGVQAALNANMKCYVLLNGSNSRSEFDTVSVTGFINDLDDLETIS